MKARGILVCVATFGLTVGPALTTGALGNVAGARAECTITGTAANDTLTGTTRDDVIRLGQGDDFGMGDDGADVVKGQQDDDQVCGNDQNDELYGGQGDDELGGSDATSNCYTGTNNDANSGSGTYETGNDFLKSRDNVSGNDEVDGGANTDTCVIDAGDSVTSCEL